MNMLLSGPFDTAQLPRIAAAPVTVTVARRVAPGRDAEFAAWAEQMAVRARAFPGSLGAGVLQPGPDGGDWQIVFRFVDGLALRLWERSPQRAALLAEADQFVVSERVHRVVGVEDWFDMPARSEPKRPLWRRIVTDVAWVYPIAILSSVFVAPVLARLPVGERTLVSTGLITLVMRLAVGPFRSRLRARRTM
jgi:antibiotic biosynthesis monooxygenase (ABM) superfamily enzyme